MSVTNLNITDLRAVLSQKQRERIDSILLIISSDKSNKEKEKLLKKRNKKDLQKAIDSLENIRKTFVVFSSNMERRVFSLDEFESRNKDYVDKSNLIRVYLKDQPKLSPIEREPLWFEALLQCFVLARLPLYQPSGEKVHADFYKKFTIRELKQILSGEINPLEIWDSVEYAKKRSVSVPNLVRLYNLENPTTPWRKNYNITTLAEIQSALGIQIPLEKDIDGIDKDIVVYYALVSGDRETELSGIRSSIIYEKLGFVRSPQTIQELFEMDTQTFNTNKDFVRRELARRWREIPTIYGDNDESFRLGITRKIKYFFIANNIRDQHPKNNLTHTSHIDDLLLALQVIERNFE